MKAKIPFLLTAGLMPLMAVAAEQSFFGNLYVNADTGAAFQQTIRVHGADSIGFGTGIRGDLTIGCQATHWLGLEFSTGGIWNSVEKIGGVSLSSYGGRGDLHQIPLLVNTVLSKSVGNFKPYIGGGIGTVVSFLDLNTPLGTIHDADWTFGYQAAAGVNYQLNQRAEFGLGYRFLQTQDHGWTDDGVTLHTQGTTTHSVLLSFTWRF